MLRSAYIAENIYRTHVCGELRKGHAGQSVRLAGFVENIRDHGGVLFVDLRDHYGSVQLVLRDPALLNGASREASVSITGFVELRNSATVNTKLETGEVEVNVKRLEVLGKAKATLPFEVAHSSDTREEVRLAYRYLDLRNSRLHSNIVLRSKVTSFLRNKMEALGFMDIATPILTCSSPEGARDYLVPSRKHPGRFYALPQAPQIFKQLLMVAGFDRYYQIAPCFRDEDARADRSPGEFYQLDFEMAYATQEDVFAVAENVMHSLFSEFSQLKVSAPPFERITYRDAMLLYGTDKPDLRNPLRIQDLTGFFAKVDFPLFKGKPVRAIRVEDCGAKPRSFFDQLEDYAKDLGMKGLGYLKVDEDFSLLGPIDKYLSEAQRKELISLCSLKAGDVIFFICAPEREANLYTGHIRTRLGELMDLIENGVFKFCFIYDFPMFELDDETGKPAFTHNPFSMPQGGLEVLNTKDPLDILAYQYDIVVNGVELSSGAVRNHDRAVMERAFEIAGYSKETLKEKFSALYSAFAYGAPPHAGMAPGLDRIVMLLAGEQNLREVIAFPMNASAQDVMLGSPSAVSEKQLREVHIRIR